MAKRRSSRGRRDKQKARRRAAQRPRPRTTPPGELHVFGGEFPDDEPDLIVQVRAALEEGTPAVFLDMASALVEATRERPQLPWDVEVSTGPGLEQLVDSLVHTPLAEATALLHAFAALADLDEVTARRVRQTLQRRPHRMPAWLTRLEDASVDRVVEMTDVLGDASNLMLQLRLPGSAPTTLIALVDHNMGSALKDGFPIPLALDDAVDTFIDAAAQTEEVGDTPPIFTDIDAADARARLTDALRVADMTLGMPETETWPMSRPLLEWAIGLLPAGGEAPVWREWSDGELDAAVRDALGSPHLDDLRDDPDAEDLVRLLLDYAAGYAGDPLRWSPTTVEILLLDWVPRKVMADEAYLRKVPAVAEAVVRAAHAERGLPAAVTARTVEVIAASERDYLAAIDAPPGVGPLAPWEEEWALDALTDEPLPDEPLDTTGMASEDADRASSIAALTDGWCDAHWDVELRTACRRLITETQRSDPATLRRGQAETAAAAICWLIGNANEAFARHDVRVKDLQAHLGIKASPRDRALTILDTLDIPIRWYDRYQLDSPAFLTSAQRRWLIHRRDETW